MFQSKTLSSSAGQLQSCIRSHILQGQSLNILIHFRQMSNFHHVSAVTTVSMNQNRLIYWFLV